MTFVNEIRFAPEISRSIRTFMGLDGDHGIVGVNELVSGMCDPWDTDRHPDIAFLRDERLCGANVLVAAVAAEFSAAALVNPAPPNGPGGMIAVVEAVSVSGATVEALFGLAQDTTITATLTNNSIGFVRDSRWYRGGAVAVGRTMMNLYTGSDPARIPQGDSYVLQPPASVGTITTPNELRYVLTPGYGLVVMNNNLNQAFKVSFIWRERRAKPGEL